MGKHPGSYPPEFRHKIIELVQSGRNMNEVSREFDLSRADDRELAQARRSQRRSP